MNPASLFILFVKIGFCCVGGGYMLVPFLSSELVEVHHLLSGESFRTLISLAQVTPGPIGINAATWTGYARYGIAGGVALSFALILPGFVLSYLAGKMMNRWARHLLVRGFFRGAKPASLGLMTSAVLVFACLSIFSGEIPWRLEAPFPKVSVVNLLIAAGVLLLKFVRKPKIGMPVIFIAAAAAGALFG